MDPASSVGALAEGKRVLASGNKEGRPERRFAVLGSFTLDYLPPMLAAGLARLGFFAKTHLCGFNQWRQEILDDASGLYAFDPDCVVLCAAVEDVFADFYTGAPLTAGRQEDRVKAELEAMASLAARLLARLPKASLYLVIPPILRLPAEGVAGPGEPLRGQGALESYLLGLRGLRLSSDRIVPVDLDWHARARGAGALADDRLWYMARMRLGMDGTKALADLVAYAFELANIPRAKVAAVDLDNTLWGGVAGEEGPEGVVVGSEGLGLAFQEFQRELLRLKDAGVLLAVCSKNDEAAAWEVFEKNPCMVLKRSDFAASRVNWLDKAENLRSLARELGLGLDSFVFLDDDPIQRAGVAAQTPAIVPELPADPALRPRFLRGLKPLHRLGLTAEDAERTRLYRGRAERESLKASCGSLKDFLATLKQEASIERLGASSVARAAQLCQKTNQFNLTTKRYGAAELSAMAEDPSVRAYTLALRDSFGDNGVVGFAVLRLADGRAEIDTLLMSCRVLGRLVEAAFAAFLAEAAAAAGARTLLGRYVPTAKNGLAKGFYPGLGFAPAEEEGLFALDLARRLAPPPEIRIIGDPR